MSPISKKSQLILRHWRKHLPVYRSHCTPWERAEFDKVIISTNSLISGLETLQEAQRWKRRGLRWYRLMYPVRCFQRVLFDGEPEGPFIIGVYLMAWFLVFTNLYWQPLRIEYELVMNRQLSPFHVLPFQGDIPEQVVERRDYRQRVWEIQLEGQWIAFTDIPNVYDYSAVNTAYQRLQTAKKVWPILPTIKEGLTILDWSEKIPTDYWLFEQELNQLHADIEDSLELQPRVQKIQPVLDSLKAVDVVIQKHPYSSFQIKKLEEQLQTSKPFVGLIEMQFQRLDENDFQLKEVDPDFAFPYTKEKVEQLTQSISLQIDLGVRLDQWTERAKTYNAYNEALLPKRPFTIEHIENLERSLKETIERREQIQVLNPILKRSNQHTITVDDSTSWPKNIPKLYENRRNIPTISQLIARAEKIGLDSGLTLFSNTTDIQKATRSIELNEQYETERQRLLGRAKRVGWNLVLSQHTLPLSEADTLELLTADTQLKEMEPLLASITQIEKHFGIEVVRPFTKSEHDLYKSLYRFDASINTNNLQSWLIIAEDMQATRYKGGQFTAGCDVEPIYCPEEVQTSTVEVIPHAFEMMNRNFTERLESVLDNRRDSISKEPNQFSAKDILHRANQLSTLYGLPICYTPINGGILQQATDFTIVKGCKGWRLPTSLEREYALKNGNGKHRGDCLTSNITHGDSLSYLGSQFAQPKVNFRHFNFYSKSSNGNTYRWFSIHKDDEGFQQYQSACETNRYDINNLICEYETLCNAINFPTFGRQCILKDSELYPNNYGYVFLVRTLP